MSSRLQEIEEETENDRIQYMEKQSNPSLVIEVYYFY